MDIRNIDTLLIRNFLICFQVFIAIIASIYYYKYKNSYLKYILYLIWYATLNECFGLLYTKYINENNSVVFNIYQIIEFSFYLFLYKNVINSATRKNIIKSFIVMYYVSIIVNCFYENFLTNYFSNNFIFGAFLIDIAIVIYLIEILNSDKIIYINKSLLFWISVANLIYYVPSIPFNVVTKYYLNSPTIPYIYLISYLLSFIVFIILTAAFIWSNKEQKR